MNVNFLNISEQQKAYEKFVPFRFCANFVPTTNEMRSNLT